jgi:D-sedoheptulose 7-phosphate isomerase
MTAPWTAPPRTGGEHLGALTRALEALEPELDRLWGWALDLADVLQSGGRLLAVGNGGSAAQAQHLTSELVGRYCNDRHPFSAHGRRGDVLVALSTSGRSPNIVCAADVAATAGLTVWAVTGPGPNPLTEAAHQALCVPAETTATVQEVHLVVVHLLCSFLDEVVGCGGGQ